LDFKFNWQNCPIGFLEQEVEKNTNFCLRMAATLPKLSIDCMKAESQADGIYKITALVRNAGYLPTFVCNEAKKIKVDKAVIASLCVDGEVIMGEKCGSIGHLEGFSGVNSAYTYNMIATSKHDPFVKELTWVVKANAGAELTLTVGNAKSGTAKKTITL
ncbi:MAG: zinc carboxypeptidase, partial [Clostridia bacterium]|nr:zinc carboxypeptidase [Clostridia bacterium]